MVGEKDMAGIKFDEIHTKTKQQLLKSMMEKVNKEVAVLNNNNPKLYKCPICSSKKLDYFCHAFNFVMDECCDCGLIFCNPYPSSEQLDHYYSSDMKDFENQFFMDTFDKRVQIFEPRVKLISNYFTEGKLLDVGAAIGIFAQALRNENVSLDVTCVDLNENACLELKDRFPEMDVINANIFELGDELKFDVITMWDTIEHIPDASQLINKISKLLAKGGIFVFSTPNTKSFEWKIARQEHVQVLPPGHVNLFNEKAINILLENNGMELVEARTMNSLLDISYVEKFIANKNLESQGLLGDYFWDKLTNNEKFIEMFSSYLISEKEAGNIISICKNK